MKRVASSKAARVALWIGAAIVLLVAGGVIALWGARWLQPGGELNETRVTTFQDWRVTCQTLQPTAPRCALSFQVMRDNGGVLISMSVTDTAPGSPLSIIVPLGVLLEPGLGFSIGAEPLRAWPYVTCTDAGCIAEVSVDAGMLKALSANGAGVIAVAVPNNPQPFSIQFSLKGFAEGHAHLKRVTAPRSSLFGFLSR